MLLIFNQTRKIFFLKQSSYWDSWHAPVGSKPFIIEYKYIVKPGQTSWARIWSRQKSAEHVQSIRPGMGCWLCYGCWAAEGFCLLWLCFHCLSAVMARSGPGSFFFFFLLLPPIISAAGCGSAFWIMFNSSNPCSGAGHGPQKLYADRWAEWVQTKSKRVIRWIRADLRIWYPLVIQCLVTRLDFSIRVILLEYLQCFSGRWLCWSNNCHHCFYSDLLAVICQSLGCWHSLLIYTQFRHVLHLFIYLALFMITVLIPSESKVSCCFYYFLLVFYQLQMCVQKSRMIYGVRF